MIKLRWKAILAALALAPACAFAQQTQTGNLNVTTTINVSCDAPSPSGTLNLPFDSNAALNAQALAAPPVRVTVTCYGNPTIQHVDFGLGNYRDATNVTAESDVRYMLRSGISGTPAATGYLGYRLFATTGHSATSQAIFDEGGSRMGTDEGSNDNRLSINASSGNYSVTGQVYETGSRAFGDATDAASGGAVPGGTYNDVVVMTVAYN